MKLLSSFIVRVQIFHQFVHVTDLMVPTLKPTGRQRSFIVLSGVDASATTSISFRQVLMANGWMAVNFQYLWVHLLQSLKLLGAELFPVNSLSTWTLFMWILHSEIVYPQVVFDTPLFLLIKLLVTTGCLDSRICQILQFFRLSDCFGQMQGHMLVASAVIATQNFLGQKSRNTSLIMPQTLLPPLLAANLQTA